MADFQPPEGLRKIACLAARDWARTHFHQQPDDRMVDAVLAALFEACTVRERWYVKHLNAKGRSNWTRIFNHYAEAVDVEARNRAAAEREGDRSVLLRTVALNWTDPPPPVSSTGEEKTDG